MNRKRKDDETHEKYKENEKVEHFHKEFVTAARLVYDPRLNGPKIGSFRDKSNYKKRRKS